eukprot:Skav231236  [mRNA]  locus=scaffold1540:26469:27371:+ [translate_table: standard]
MLERLVDPNITINGCTGLHMALDRQARLGDIQLRELVTLFMDSHSDPNLLDCHGSSPLSLAIRIGVLESTRYDIVDELCKGQADVNARDGSTYTPLHMAAYYGRTSIARRLLEFGADLNSQAPPLPMSWWVSRDEHRDPWWAGHETALHFASGRGHLHTVHLLITFKARLEILDGRGQNWLQVATGSVATLHQAFLATTSQQATPGRCPRACDTCHAGQCKKLPGHYHICLSCLRTQSEDPDLSLPLIWRSSVARCPYKCLDCYDRGCRSNCCLQSSHDCTTCICATCAADHPGSMVEVE